MRSSRSIMAKYAGHLISGFHTGAVIVAGLLFWSSKLCLGVAPVLTGSLLSSSKPQRPPHPYLPHCARVAPRLSTLSSGVPVISLRHLATLTRTRKHSEHGMSALHMDARPLSADLDLFMDTLPVLPYDSFTQGHNIFFHEGLQADSPLDSGSLEASGSGGAQSSESPTAVIQDDHKSGSSKPRGGKKGGTKGKDQEQLERIRAKNRRWAGWLGRQA